MAKVIESSVNRFVCSNISFHNYVVHMWRILGSRLELWFHIERGNIKGVLVYSLRMKFIEKVF